MSTTCPCLQCHLCVPAWLCSADVSWLLLWMTVPWPQLEQRLWGRSRAGLWGHGCGQLALATDEEVTAGVTGRGCSSQHPWTGNVLLRMPAPPDIMVVGLGTRLSLPWHCYSVQGTVTWWLTVLQAQHQLFGGCLQNLAAQPQCQQSEGISC